MPAALPAPAPHPTQTRRCAMLPTPEPTFDLTHAQILFLMLAAQLCLFGVAWKVAIKPPPGLQGTLKGLSAFNLVTAVSMVLIGLRGHGPYL